LIVDVDVNDSIEAAAAAAAAGVALSFVIQKDYRPRVNAAL